MGEEDAVLLRNYTKNVTCESSTGELFVITIQDFHQRVKPYASTWNQVLRDTN
jgi:hypothetical protein